MAGKQSRSFLGILYPDSESYVCDDVLCRIRDFFDDVSYITHDMDTTDEGELKKPHIHWVGKRSSPALLSTVANALRIPERDIEFCKSYKYSLRYLIHADNPEKYQYDPKSVSSNTDYLSFISNKLEAMRSRQIYNYINSASNISLNELANWCFVNDLWSEYRRSFAIWSSLLRELQVK